MWCVVMKKKMFFKNLMLLTVASVLSRIIGIIFRVYMSSKVSPEGIGLYQLISTVYFFAITFATSGISLAVTRLVTDFIANNEYIKAKMVTRLCICISLMLSFIASFTILLNAQFIGDKILFDTRTVLSLKILAFSLPFVAISACFRGYFYAVRKVFNTASEQLFEQIIEIAVFMILIGEFSKKGLAYSCCAIVIGTTIAEILSCVYSFILYSKDMHKYKASGFESNGLIKSIFKISMPITLSSCLRSGLNMVENTLIPSGLNKYLASESKSLSIYGMISGMVLPIISFPAVLLLSFSSLLIPEMSEANAINHKNNINHMTSVVLRFTLLFSILISGIFFIFHNDLSMLIYKTEEAGIYIKILAPIVTIMYLDMVIDGMLKGLNQQMYHMSYNITDSILRVILIYIFVPKFGLNAFIAVIFISEIFNFYLSLRRLIFVTKLNINIKEWLIKPIISISITLFLFSFISLHFNMDNLYNPLIVILKIIFFIMTYMISLKITNSITKDDIYWMKNSLCKNN